jgi:putative ABC transport system permease protein
VLISLATLDKLGLPGGHACWRYAGRSMKAPASEQQLKACSASQGASRRRATIADRRDPRRRSCTPERLRQFLTLIGLTALVGGVGIANAVATHRQRRKVIATMKSTAPRAAWWSASSSRLRWRRWAWRSGWRWARWPIVLNVLYGEMVPIHAEMTVSALASARRWSTGSAWLLFTLWPLGRVERVSASAVRDGGARHAARLGHRGDAGCGGGARRLALLTRSKHIALYFCLSRRGVRRAFAWARLSPGAQLPAPAHARAGAGHPQSRCAGRPDALGGASLVPGCRCFVAVALADSLVQELQERLPTSSPDYFVLDVPKEIMAISAPIERECRVSVLEAAPMLRGGWCASTTNRWTSTLPRGAVGAQRRPRAALFDEVPHGSKVVAGEWWAPGYDGEPLVSFEADLPAFRPRSAIR